MINYTPEVAVKVAPAPNPINFTPDAHQRTLIAQIREFANTHVTDSAKAYKKVFGAKDRFQATRPAYEAGWKAGLIRDSVPESLGGGNRSIVDAAFQWEELAVVDPSIGITVLANSLGLGPIVHGATPEQQRKWLAPFISTEGDHLPCAALCFTEVGGGANWLSENGMKTTCIQDGDEWVINGEKIWPNISGGWDDLGATIQCVVGKTSLTIPGKDSMGCIVVTREDIARNAPGAFEIVRDAETTGCTAMSGPHIRYKNLRVPLENAIGKPGAESIELVSKSFTESGALIGAVSVGVMRHAFELALPFCQTNSRNGPHPIIGYQAVADLLTDCKAKIEAARMLVWRACDDLDKGLGYERAYLAKIYASDSCIEVVTSCARVIGILAVEREIFPFDELLNDALVMSLFDGGNIAVRRRQVQAIFSSPEYTVEMSRGF